MFVHPAADVWPMLTGDELQALADSIAEVGLLEPIVLTPDGLLLDGRNRAAACALVGVTPATTVYDGDPVAFVLARNDQRRHMTKGQRAMAAWLTASLSQSESTTSVAGRGELSLTQIGMAKVVAEHAPDLAPVVVAGARSLKDAYDEARTRRDLALGEEERLARLPDDLATQVREGDLRLDEAEAVIRQREQRRADERRDARALLLRILDLAAPAEPTLDFTDAWAARLGLVEPDLLSRIHDAIDVLTDLAKRVDV